MSKVHCVSNGDRVLIEMDYETACAMASVMGQCVSGPQSGIFAALRAQGIGHERFRLDFSSMGGIKVVPV
jgi:hypothetical protein